jgi:peroxiredoxin
MKKFLSIIIVCFFISNYGNGQFNLTKTLKVGDTIPDVEIVSLENTPVKISGDHKGQPMVLIFYRAQWCPFCVEHLAEIQPSFKTLMKLGYKLIAISTDNIENIKSIKENNYLKYTLLSDWNREAIIKYGIVNGNVAVPSVFIVDKDHIIRFLHTNPDYKVRLTGDEIVNKAKEVMAK